MIVAYTTTSFFSAGALEVASLLSLGVMIVLSYFAIRPALVAAACEVLAFDYYFVPPVRQFGGTGVHRGARCRLHLARPIAFGEARRHTSATTLLRYLLLVVLALATYTVPPAKLARTSCAITAAVERPIAHDRAALAFRHRADRPQVRTLPDGVPPTFGAFAFEDVAAVALLLPSSTETCTEEAVSTYRARAPPFTV